MAKRIVTLGLVQMSMGNDPAANLQKAVDMTAEAASEGAQMVVLPELFVSPYFCQRKEKKSAFNLAEPIPGSTSTVLCETARKHHIVLIGGSIFEKASDGAYYNTAPVFGPDGKMIGMYRKMHIPHDPSFYEQDYFAPGDTGIHVHDTPFGKISVLICYDQWFPEAARIAALKGAELLIYPTAIANVESVAPVDSHIPEHWEEHWRAAQVGHAAVNNVYVAAVNRVGTEGKSHFWGGSFVANPGGLVIAKADDREQVLLAQCDLSYVKNMQNAWRFFAERRPEMYSDILKT